tara:strand:- start:1945 stop:2055 length:111 start_codon:yes stop_codon:yes gene_type:complete
MIKAIGWLCIAWVVLVVSKAIAKKLFPEDWKNEPFD